MLGLVNHLLHQFQKGCCESLQRVYIVWSVNDRELGDAIYRDYLMPIMEDSEEIHQSTIQSAMTFSPFYYDKLQQGSQKLHGGVINIPKRGVFEFHLHLTGLKKQEDKGMDNGNSPSNKGQLPMAIHTPEDENHKGMLHPHLWKFGRPNLQELLTKAGKLCDTLNKTVSYVSPPTSPVLVGDSTESPLHQPSNNTNAAITALNKSDSGSSSEDSPMPKSSPVKQFSFNSTTTIPAKTKTTTFLDSNDACRVGVMVAGPTSLREDVRTICNQDRHRFDLHEEAFSF
jgi:hypothetical protein